MIFRTRLSTRQVQRVSWLYMSIQGIQARPVRTAGTLTGMQGTGRGMNTSVRSADSEPTMTVQLPLTSEREAWINLTAKVPVYPGSSGEIPRGAVSHPTTRRHLCVLPLRRNVKLQGSKPGGR